MQSFRTIFIDDAFYASGTQDLTSADAIVATFDAGAKQGLGDRGRDARRDHGGQWPLQNR